MRDIVDFIGNTPLIKLKYPSEITYCEIYGKAEFMNPGGSVKDRMATFILNNAEEQGLIKLMKRATNLMIIARTSKGAQTTDH